MEYYSKQQPKRNQNKFAENILKMKVNVGMTAQNVQKEDRHSTLYTQIHTEYQHK